MIERTLWKRYQNFGKRYAHVCTIKSYLRIERNFMAINDSMYLLLSFYYYSALHSSHRITTALNLLSLSKYLLQARDEKVVPGKIFWLGSYVHRIIIRGHFLISSLTLSSCFFEKCSVAFKIIFCIILFEKALKFNLNINRNLNLFLHYNF